MSDRARRTHLGENNAGSLSYVALCFQLVLLIVSSFPTSRFLGLPCLVYVCLYYLFGPISATVSIPDSDSCQSITVSADVSRYTLGKTQVSIRFQDEPA